jgi:class 3 adenylate cyclase/tetratricopeptide (TPR) repeat protein
MAGVELLLPAHVAAALPLPARTGIRRSDGAALVVDVRGFTALSEACDRRAGRAGGELVAAALSEFFDPLVALAGTHGASISHFAGDAMVLVLPERDGAEPATARAALLGRTMLRRIDEHPGVRVGRRRIRLTARAGAAGGGYAWFWLATRERRFAVTCGTAPAAAVAAQRRAATGALVADGRAARSPHAGRPVAVPRGPARRFVHPAVAARIAGGLQLLLAEHREVAVVACDVTTRPDDIARLRDAVGVVARAAAEAGGLLLPVDPAEDGARLLVVFGAPVQHEDAALRALRMAAACAELPAAVGVESGRAFSGLVGGRDRADYTVIGDPVNVAARLAASAPPGAVLAGPGIHDRTEADIAWPAGTAVTVKGRRGALVVRRAPLPDTAVRAMTRRPLPMVGRRTERARLRRAMASGGTPILVTGEAGIGKSRLVGDLHDADGDPWHVVRFTEPSGAHAWAPLVRGLVGAGPGTTPSRTAMLVRRALAAVDSELAALTPLVAELAGVAADETPTSRSLDGERRARTARELLGALLRAAPGRRVVLVEDAHHATPGDARTIAELVAATRRDRAVVLLVARRDTDALRAAVDAPLRVALGPLAPRSAQRLVREALRAPAGERLVRGLARRANGNPFVAIELAGLVRDTGADLAGAAPAGLPDSVERLVLARFDRLPPDVQNTLRVASIATPPFDAGSLSGARPSLGRPPTVGRSLDRAADAGVLAPEGNGDFRFAERLFADVVRGSLAAATSRTLHAGAARNLERTQGDDAADAIAHHYGETDLGAPRRRWFRRAADLAVARHDHERAAEHLAALAPLLRGAGRRGALRDLAASSRIAGEWDAATRALREALGGRPDPAEQAKLACELGDLLTYTGSWDDGLELLARSVDELRQLAQPREEARALGLLAYAAFRRSDLERARDAAARELELGRALADRWLEADALHKLAQAAWHLDGPSAAAGPAARSLTGMRATGDLVGVMEVANDLAGIELELGHPDAAARRLATSARAARRIGDRAALATIAGNAAELCLAAGDLDAAERMVARQSELAGAVGDATAVHVALGHAGHLEARRGRPAAARPLLADAARRAAAAGEPYFLCEYLLDLGVVQAQLGHRPAADRSLGAAARAAEQAGDGEMAARARRRQATLRAGRDPRLRRHAGPRPSSGAVRMLTAAVGPGRSAAPPSS